MHFSFAISKEFAKNQIICYCLLCGFMGAITVLSSKGISTAINQAIAGHPEMFTSRAICWLTYVLFLTAAGSIIMQMKYLNRALMHFGSSVVVPVYYIVFTSITISTGMVIFLEVNFDSVGHARGVALFVFGLLFAFFGVYLINSQAGEQDTVLREFKPLMGSGADSDRELPAAEPATREELQVVFDNLDRARTGRVEAKEVEALAAALGGGCQWRERFVTGLLARLAADPSGSITFDQFDRWYHEEHAAAGDAAAEEQRELLRALAHRLKVASDVLCAMGCQVPPPFPAPQHTHRPGPVDECSGAADPKCTLRCGRGCFIGVRTASGS